MFEKIYNNLPLINKNSNQLAKAFSHRDFLRNPSVRMFLRVVSSVRARSDETAIARRLNREICAAPRQKKQGKKKRRAVPGEEKLLNALYINR